MPPRIPILSAFRPGKSLKTPKTPIAPITTTKAPQALRDTGSTSGLLNLDRQQQQQNNNDNNNNNNNNNSRSSVGSELAGSIYSSLRLRQTEPRGPDGRRGGSSPGATTNATVVPGQTTESLLRDQNRHRDYLRQMRREWQRGDVYAPHDLSAAEMAKSGRRQTGRRADVVDQLGLRPLDMYRNFCVISEFMTSQGRIMKRSETGLRPVNQRKMAKAIRRAIGLGLHPSVHAHPELLVGMAHKGYAPNNMPTMRNLPPTTPRYT